PCRATGVAAHDTLGPMVPDADAPFYDERLRVPAGWWAGGGGLTIAIWWTFFVATPAWVAFVAAVLAGSAIVAALGQYGSATVEVGSVHLRAGTARVPLAHCGAGESLD